MSLSPDTFNIYYFKQAGLRGDRRVISFCIPCLLELFLTLVRVVSFLQLFYKRKSMWHVNQFESGPGNYKSIFVINILEAWLSLTTVSHKYTFFL